MSLHTILERELSGTPANAGAVILEWLNRRGEQGGAWYHHEEWLRPDLAAPVVKIQGIGHSVITIAPRGDGGSVLRVEARFREHDGWERWSQSLFAELERLGYLLPKPAATVETNTTTTPPQPPSGAPPPGEQGQAVEKLTDHEKTMLQLWGDNYTAEDIASWPGISWSAGTIRNKLTELRKALGEERVPYHRK